LFENTLKARTNNEYLYVTGLSEGKLWSIYNIIGVEIYSNVASGKEAIIRLPPSGFYVIRCENKFVKVVVFR